MFTQLFILTGCLGAVCFFGAALYPGKKVNQEKPAIPPSSSDLS
jgi:hypothetical protein